MLFYFFFVTKKMSFYNFNAIILTFSCKLITNCIDFINNFIYLKIPLVRGV